MILILLIALRSATRYMLRFEIRVFQLVVSKSQIVAQQLYTTSCVFYPRQERNTRKGTDLSSKPNFTDTENNFLSRRVHQIRDHLVPLHARTLTTDEFSCNYENSRFTRDVCVMP